MPRPTQRTTTVLLTTLLLYFFANQTQVGWLYVMVSLLLGLVITTGLLNRGSLRRLTGTRQIGSPREDEIHEGNEVGV
ncbi:MAG: hypothetical protein GYB68_17520 [Chloroflexi bacterium]|nr:hypothetical protein [Chloroflexota bacterium]